MTIPIAMPFMGEEEALAVREVILSGWVTQGPKVSEFENAFASYVGSKHACAVSSCTTALHLALLAVGVRPGDVVITVSHSFIATANSVRHCGAEPVFVDIEPDSYNMSPESLERFLAEECDNAGGQLYYKDIQALAHGESPLKYLTGAAVGRRLGRVAALMPVHQMGMPCDLNAILPIARRFGIPVVEDAACAIGSEILMKDGWEKIGKPHGDIACFSFHPRKIITTGDGGMLTTDNAGYDSQFRLLRQHGMTVSDKDRHSSDRIVLEKYATTGYNYRMTDIQAAVGTVQMKRLPDIVKERRRLAELYNEGLKGIAWLKASPEPAWCRNNWQSYPVRLSEGAPVGRNELMQRFLDAGISTRPGIMNAHAEQPYENSTGFSLGVSESARENVVLLPLYYGLQESRIPEIMKLLEDKS